jgi:hypothetical protein
MGVINDLHRAPVLKTSSKSGLPIAWITGYATIPQPKAIHIRYSNSGYGVSGAGTKN